MEPFRDASLAPGLRARDLLARLSLREKVGQLNQRLYGFAAYTRQGDDLALTPECEAEIEKWSGLGALYGLYRADPWSGKDESTGIPPRLAPKAYNLVQRKVLEASPFGIPALMTAEASHGMVSVGGYMLPANAAMGATFNRKLCRDAFAVYGKQAKAQGIDYALMSVLDVLRDPRWGRSEECFGEDPLLCRTMAEAAVSGCAAQGVDVVAKHLGGQGETTGGINSSPARLGWRELREIHLPSLQGALEGGASGVMAAYNEIDGVPCHANSLLLREYLREECGFEGVVMADGTAMDRLDEITGSNMLSGALALESGVDISLWDTAFSHLEEAVLGGHVPEALLDEAVLRVLETKFRRGLFENPYMDETKPVPVFTPLDHPQTLEAARQSVVLLENKNRFLPMDGKDWATVAVLGPNAHSLYNQTGDYSRPFSPGEGITVLQGVEQALPGGKVLHAEGCGTLRGDREQLAQALEAAKESDLVILALGGSSNRFGEVRFDETGAAIAGGDLQMDCGEGVDRADLNLPPCQQQLFEEVCALGKPVVCIVMGGRPYVVAPFARQASALLYSFYPGPCGGQALAEILFGQQNPSGRLPASLPRHSGALLCWYNGKYAAKNRVYCDMDSAALYSFGYGLSYTRFSLEGASAQAIPQGGVAVTFALQNTGSLGGYAVPMVYLRWLRGRITARKKELKAFDKIWLEAGERQTVTLTIPPRELLRWDADMKQRPGSGPVLLMLEEGGQSFWSGQVTVNEEGNHGSVV